ncbi:hypothetical protein DL546_001804 [Coniochaeta pulveracea]|uniref:DUF1295 domain protein n=1 Tax=Coniochaeta pulveracea TaxID=177199 RepID=A0A420XXA2_9PEZI|nr:hypothetical protein DL546_001804 [Coniochaeta pulveracea]
MTVLPALVSLEDCADFAKTVKPFVPQLYELPGRFVETVRTGGSVAELYRTTNPLVTGFAISILLGAVFLVVAEVNRNYSQVDRCWSLLPTFYIAHFDLWARLTGVPHQRVDAALLFSTLWTVRLTFNYWRKGGYERGSEDYRWKIVRDRVGPTLFHIFNWTFISFIQSILLFLLAAPVYPIMLSTQFDAEIQYSDVAFVAIELGLILVEVFADQQQWLFQNAKKEYQESAKVPRGWKQADLDRGFVTTGLWGYSRHPNFAAEQSIWLVLYQWSCFATKSLYNWTGVGPSFLVLLFQSSTWLTELITAGKYSEYKAYQRAVGMFVPKSVSSYRTKAAEAIQPKVIRTSDLAKKQQEKEKKKHK